MSLISLLSLKVDKYNNVSNASWNRLDAFVDTLKQRIYKQKEFKMYNTSHRKQLFESYINNLNHKVWSVTMVMDILNTHDMTTADIFAEAILDNMDWLQVNPHIKPYLSCINTDIPVTSKKEKRLTKRQQQGKALYEAGIRGMSIEDAEKYTLNEELEERLVVVRNRYGNETPSVFVMQGSWDELTVRQFRMSFAYETGSNYYEASPILFSTCIADPERFYATKGEEYSNDDDILEYEEKEFCA